MADALASGASARKGVEVQLLSRAQNVPLTRGDAAKGREVKTSRLFLCPALRPAADKGECFAGATGALSGTCSFPTRDAHPPRSPHDVKAT